MLYNACMRCPICNEQQTKVVDSRNVNDGVVVRRRRECDECEFRFSTHEEVALLDLTVVKRNGEREHYSRDKLVKGIERALEKRPYTDDQFHQLINKIERDIQKKRKNQLTSGQLGEIVMGRLEEFDEVAYIRFASVYRSFEDVETFEKALKQLGEQHSDTK